LHGCLVASGVTNIDLERKSFSLRLDRDPGTSDPGQRWHTHELHTHHPEWIGYSEKAAVRVYETLEIEGNPQR